MPKPKMVNDTPEQSGDGSIARQRVIVAARAEIRRRASMIIKLERLDERVHAAALRTFESPDAAADWLIEPAIGLCGAIPVVLARTEKGRKRVLWILGCIEHSVFT